MHLISINYCIYTFLHMYGLIHTPAKANARASYSRCTHEPPTADAHMDLLQPMRARASYSRCAHKPPTADAHMSLLQPMHT